jgi:hypothetical protein
MTRILIPALAPALILAWPAQAHDGAHFHPHGIESSLGAMALLTVFTAGVVALAWWRR